ncbi:MAG: hypothetical protein C0603_07225 [Denitrovibrio sp.]|nr:MAG: hypothetical protein C0603_07225 [Denitrovibrio sp.]
MRIFSSLILVIFALTVSVDAKIAGFFIDRAMADSMYVKASLYEQDGNFEEASRMLEVVLETIDDEYIYLKLANIYNKLKDDEMLKYTLERAVRKNSESYALIGALADFYRGNKETATQSYVLYQKAYKLSGNPMYAEGEAIAHAALKDYNGAIKIYDNLIKENPKSSYYVQRARFFDKLGLIKESIEDYVKAADIDGNFVAAAKLSDYYVKEGKNEEAIKYLRMVISASPDLAIAKFRMAELLRKIGKTDEAADFYAAIIDSLNESERVYVLKQLATIYFRKKDFDKAEEYFSRAYEINDDTQTAYSLALLAEATKDYETAIDWYQKILVKRPDFVEASKRLAIIYIQETKLHQALDTLDSVEPTYQDVDFFRIKSQIYTDQGNLDMAIEILSKAVAENPAEIKLYVDLALAYDKNKEKLKAESTIEDGLKSFPEDPSLLNFLGYMYVEQGKRLDEAKELIQKALDQKPDEPAYLDSMAWLLYQKGRFEEALSFQKRALKGAPEEEEIRNHMKDILKKLGIRKTLDEIIQED